MENECSTEVLSEPRGGEKRAGVAMGTDDPNEGTAAGGCCTIEGTDGDKEGEGAARARAASIER